MGRCIWESQFLTKITGDRQRNSGQAHCKMASALKVRNTRGWLWIRGEILAQYVPSQHCSQHYIGTQKIKTESLKMRPLPSRTQCWFSWIPLWVRPCFLYFDIVGNCYQMGSQSLTCLLEGPTLPVHPRLAYKEDCVSHVLPRSCLFIWQSLTFGSGHGLEVAAPLHIPYFFSFPAHDMLLPCSWHYGY